MKPILRHNKQIVLTLHADGSVSWLGDEPPLDLPIDRAQLTKRRVSTITPAFAPLKGPAFRLLRLLFGETGRVAAWTRKWRGPWICRILATGEWSVFTEREDAIAWEIDKLNEDLANWDL